MDHGVGGICVCDTHGLWLRKHGDGEDVFPGDGVKAVERELKRMALYW